MAIRFSWRVGVIRIMQFAFAAVILLCSTGLRSQTEATPASPTPVSPTAEDRKNFADTENRRIEKKLAEILPDAVSDISSAEGPDATYYVWYITPGPADASKCKGDPESYTSNVSKYGFTKLIYIDEKGGSCELDLITHKVTVPSRYLPPTEEANQIWKTIHDAEAAKQAIVAQRAPVTHTPQERKDRAGYFGKRPWGYDSAEGPDATYYVLYRPRDPMTESTCTSFFTDSIVADLRELGFTKIVCKGKNDTSSSFNTDARPRPVEAQASPTLPAGTDWAEGTIQGYFGPTIEQKVNARSDPAKVTGEEESVLTSKRYVRIGTIRATQPGKKGDADVMQEIERAILKKAAEAGGDVVRFSSEGTPEVVDVPTGKTKTKKICLKTAMGLGLPTYTKSCIATSAGPQCSTSVFQGPVERCVEFGTEEIPITRKEHRLVSEGTVWRNDPKLAADIARAAETAR
jgi:hypothetical protein